VLAALATAVAGCAIPNDPQPRRIDPGAVPYDLLNPTTAPPTTLGRNVPVDESIIFLAQEADRVVVPTLREVARPVTLDGRLLQLIEARPNPEERDKGLSNVITRHTRIREVRQDRVDGVRRVIIDLDRFFPGLGSEDVSLAVAQVVFTVDLQYPDAEVEFRVDGQTEGIRTAAGTSLDVVSRKDFCQYAQEEAGRRENTGSTATTGAATAADPTTTTDEAPAADPATAADPSTTSSSPTSDACSTDTHGR
jgi:hypothetical protein